MLHLSRNKRYTLTPEKLQWDKFKLTYKYSSAFLPSTQQQITVVENGKRKTYPPGKLRLMLVLAGKHKHRYFSAEVGISKPYGKLKDLVVILLLV